MSRTRLLWPCHGLVVAVMVVFGAPGISPALPQDDRAPAVLETREGLASFYGKRLHGRRTASGQTFDMHEMVAAHPSYPFGTRLRVRNLDNDRQATVRIVDRGPGRGPRREGVIIDLSRGAARELGFVEEGRIRVRVEVLEWGDDR